MPTPEISQKAGKLNIVIEKGARFDPVLTWKTAGVAVDLTSYTARMQIRATQSSETILIDLTTENGGIALGGAAGTISLVITNDVTEAIDWAKGVYDLELVSPSGYPTRLVEGIVKVRDEVTR